MAWQQLKFRLKQSQAEEISEQLEAMGALAVSFSDAHDDAIFEPAPGTTPLWPESVVQALFTEDFPTAGIVTFIEDKLACAVEIEHVADQAWERAWLDHFKPMQFADKLWVYPSTYDVPEQIEHYMVLDPGLAFGTGTHPTTALCLEALAQYTKDGLQIIDYGCGSGILAVAALKLGAKQAIAIDIDPQALQATTDNANKNDIHAQQLFCCLPENIPQDCCADLLIANILANPLKTLAKDFYELLKPGALLILSGILDKQLAEIREVYSELFVEQELKVQDEWLCMIWQKAKL